MTEQPADDTDEAVIDASTAISDTNVATRVSSTYKVLGELNAPSGTGVLGRNTATSGAATGVEGVTDSTDASAAGVRGQATATSGAAETYGVQGITQSRANFAAGVRAEAPKGNATALRAESNNGGPGVYASSDSLSFALWAQNTSTSPNASTGIRGDALGAGDDIAGVLGKAFDSGINQSYGIKGVTDAAGSSSGATQPAGVRGEATNSSGITHGVHGSNLTNAANEFEAPFPTGVFGDTDTPDHQGVIGTNTATSGSSSYGVVGYTESPNAPAVLASNAGGGPGIETDGDAAIDGSVSVTGHVEARDGYRGRVGASVYRSTDQSISANSRETIIFDTEDTDERAEYDTGTGKFTCAFDGTYSVECMVIFENLNSGDLLNLEIWKNGQTREATKEIIGVSGNQSEGIHKTFFNLVQGEELEIRVRNHQSSSRTVGGNRTRTYMTVHQVG